MPEANWLCSCVEKRIIILISVQEDFNSADYSFFCNLFGFLNAMVTQKNKRNLKWNFIMLVQKI